MVKMNIHVDDTTCCLCDENITESHLHLFSKCGRYKVIRDRLATWTGINGQQQGVKHRMEWLKRRRCPHLKKEVIAAIWSVTLYHIWRARNWKSFRDQSLDWSLITTLIEQWRPEMHTFHLPTGEATSTLQDVRVLYGLRIDGPAVALPQYMRAMTRAQYLDLLGKYTGSKPQGEAIVRGGSHISVTAIREHMELDELPQYSWGVAVLAYLYRSICWASMGTQVDICGLGLAADPAVAATSTTIRAGYSTPFLPLARRWVLRHGNYRGTDAHHNLPIVRDVLDMLEAAQFIWMPYNDELLADLPDYCSSTDNFRALSSR
ncbi:serine/threonine-protein phosphatase 7 long form homolog [Nicotiana sylvestris]|uniref:serine/threonine-protein phosphatase 7 long form homolog n=1 Tax=Nicotiana sylvestris TaxID=4096 RepID=UPI00388C8DF6